MRLKGVESMRARMTRIMKGFPSTIGQAAYAELQVELQECIKRTPRDTGALRASEHVTPPKIDGNRISIGIVAGGPSAPYAVQVHEDLEAFHPIGEAKFIESVLNESGPHMAERIARRLKFL